MDTQKNKEKQHITLFIYDTPIDINVPPEQEQQYREAGSLINERLNTYFSYFKGQKPDKEIIYYALIDIALKCVMESKRNDVEPMNSILSELAEEITEVLKN